jgi:tetratricopeptide (TPR) repeat protein
MSAVVIGWAVRGTAARPRDAARWGMAFGAAVLAVIAPVTVRNGLVSGQWVPISTNAGVNLFIGNQPDADRLVSLRPGLDWERLVARPYREGGAGNAAESQRWFIRRVAGYAAAQPLRFAAGLAVKAWRLTGAHEIPRNVDPGAAARRSRVLRPLLWRAGPFGFPSGLLWPLAWIGIAAALTARGPEAAPPRGLAAALLLYLGSIVLFFPASRYLAPVVPLVILLAARGVATVRGALAGERSRARWLAALGAAFVFVNLPRSSATAGVDFDAELDLHAGIALQTRGYREHARAQYDVMLHRRPDVAEGWFYRGTVLRELGRTEQAIASHRTALALRPDHHKAMKDLAVLLFNRGQTGEAVEWLRRAVQLDPEDKDAMGNLAVGLAAMGRIEEANDWFRKAGRPPISGLSE